MERLGSLNNADRLTTLQYLFGCLVPGVDRQNTLADQDTTLCSSGILHLINCSVTAQGLKMTLIQI